MRPAFFPACVARSAAQVLVDFSTFLGRVVADEIVNCELQRTATKLTAKGRGRLVLKVSSGVIQVGKHRQSIVDSASLQLGEYLDEGERGDDERKLGSEGDGSESKLGDESADGAVRSGARVREGGVHTGIVSVTVLEGRCVWRQPPFFDCHGFRFMLGTCTARLVHAPGRHSSFVCPLIVLVRSPSLCRLLLQESPQHGPVLEARPIRQFAAGGRQRQSPQ